MEQSEGPPEQFIAAFRCFGGLQNLLARRPREGAIEYRFRGHPGVKDAIEALGVPHTEVDAILVNGLSVGFDYQLQPGDAIAVYPVHAPVPAQPLRPLSPQPPDPAVFILDVHLGKLARRLRLLGFDCLYDNHYGDAEIVQLASARERIILTCDRGLLKHRQVRHGYLVRSDAVTVQVREVLARYQLAAQVQLWRRCMSCNGLLARVDKSAVAHRLEPKTRLYYDDFHRCTACGRLYWPGSHYAGIERWLNTILEPDSSTPVS
jgi:uncharacterized protein with PIN domain